MRKIIFNEETIGAIRQFISEGHTIAETCNKFTLKEDTLRRVMYENNIQAFHKEKRSCVKIIDSDLINIVCGLYVNTDITLQELCKEVKLENYVVQDILKKHFSEAYMNERKSKLYRASKLGDKNPMKSMTGQKHFNWIGVVDDGNGYCMVKKPTWYTGRKGSDYVFQHSVVMCEALGITEIPQGFVVHHIDRNPKNNHIDNLALMTVSGHGKLHSIENKLCKAQRLSTKE